MVCQMIALPDFAADHFQCAMPNTFETNIGGLLGSTRRERIVVPQFQRGYEWKPEHVEAFWTDITEFKRQRGLKDSSRNHFFGPIVIHMKGETWELLDGQQRLATCTILLSVIRDVAQSINIAEAAEFSRDTHSNFILKSDGQRSLTLSETDELFFRERIQSNPPLTSKPKVRTQRKIEWVRNFLQKKVETDVTASTPQAAISFLKELRQVLISDLTVACIPVDSEREAFKIFETLNDRGLKLAAPDLLLNLLMGSAPEPERKSIRSLWTEMIEGLAKFDLKDFLRHYWISKYGDIKTADLFSVIKEHIQKNRTNSLSFVRECAEECERYSALVHVDETLGNSRQNVKSLLTDLNADASLPLLLSAHGRLTEDEFQKVCACSLVYITRYAIMGDLDRAGLENKFFSLARETRSKLDSGIKGNQCFLWLKEEFKKSSPEDKQIDNRGFTLSSVEARYVMSKLANHIQGERKEVGVTEFTNIEHIYPKNPNEAEWGGQDNHDIMDKYTDHIGNLTILSRRLNAKLQNSEYAVKREKYRESKVAMTQEIAKKYDKWDERTVIDRAHRLVAVAKKLWTYDDLSRV